MADKLKLIECTHGYAETNLGGQTYIFDRDGYGRFTSDVFDLTHRSLLLSVVHYREVDRELPPEDLSALDFADESEHAGDGDDADDQDEDADNDADNDGLANADNDVAQEPEPEAQSEPVAAEPAAAPAPKPTRKAK